MNQNKNEPKEVIVKEDYNFWRCPSCGSLNEPSKKNCFKCGQAVVLKRMKDSVDKEPKTSDSFYNSIFRDFLEYINYKLLVYGDAIQLFVGGLIVILVIGLGVFFFLHGLVPGLLYLILLMIVVGILVLLLK